jgi:head-tail adaptor
MSGAGDKSELITVERVALSADGGGGGARTWSTLGQLWAEVTWIGGDESSRQGALRTKSKYRFTVWSAAATELGLTADDRLVWGGETYNIRERPRALQTQPETEIIAESGVTQ